MSIEPDMRVAPTIVRNVERAGRRLAILAACLVTILVPAQPASRAGPRDLTLQERFQAQRAIEQVYYAHQIGAQRTFAEAVPDSVIEAKVRTYLKQSLALARFWRTPITEDALRREASRMARDTRLPGRLAEIHAALHNDPQLILECLARPVLADRLARNFFASDERIHAGTRGRAEALRDRVVHRGAGPEREERPPEVLEIRDVDSDPSGRDVPRAETRSARPTDPDSLQVDAGSFARWRSLVPDRVGEIGPLVETREAFLFRILLEESEGRIVIATHTVPKVTWDAWWVRAESDLDGREVETIVRSADPLSFPLPDPSTASWSAATNPACLPDDTWDNGILNAFPSAREEHTGVWTGSVMVVWGGTADGTGGRYDPATDTWAPTTTANAPAGRKWHTAVWTGTEMIVWGGASLGGSGTLNTGGRYDPVADRWTATSTLNAPSIRYYHSAVWSPRGMIVWGGYAPGYLNTGGIYDPTTDTWAPTTTANAPVGRMQHTAVWTGQLMIVWGGHAFDPLSSGAAYDPSMNTWTDIPPAPIEGRFLHSAVWTGTEMIIWGGQLRSGIANTGARFRPTTGWFLMSPVNAPSQRQWHGVVWTGSEMIVWGGYSAGPPSASSNGGRYDPARNVWSSVSSVNAPDLTRLAAVWTGSLMIAMGGRAVGGRYDPSTDTWTPTAILNAPSPRSDHTAVWTGTQMIVWGGTGGGSTGGRYDPALDSWSPTSVTNAPASRKDHTAVWTGDRMVVWGGRSPAQMRGGRYDPVTDAWEPTSLGGAPAARFFHTAVWTGSEMIVWGGTDGTKVLQSGGRYDPRANTWRSVGTTGAPSGRAYHTAVWTGSEMVVWGGWDVNATMLGARYDPASDTWAPTSISNVPSARFLHTAVWTGREMIVWGGAYGYSSGGRYDPASDLWLATSLTDAPTPRDDHTAVWTGREMMIWGGTGKGPTGGRYDPSTDIWRATSTLNAPTERGSHTAVWTGAFMIVWGGSSLDSGGRYAVSQAADFDGDGYSVCAGDCNDTLPTAHPGAPEACNGIDDDCSGEIDEGTDALCGDTSPCTADRCAGVAGCQHPPEADGTPCDEGNDCTVGDACQAGACAAGTLRDTDDDGHADGACGGDDCLDIDPAIWSPPVEVVNLAVGATSPARLTWDNQTDLAGPGTNYDLVSGAVPWSGTLDLSTATCLLSSPGTSFEDPRPDPPQDAAYWYLVRGRNACGAGTYGTPARDASIPPCP